MLVRGLLWRSHTDEIELSKEENEELGEIVNRAGGEILLDHRVRRAGSHHQKFVVLRHPGRPGLDVAFAGGIDLCRGRRDDADHRGDEQVVPMNDAYGERVAWHDVQVALRGPVVGHLDTVFRERWDDPAPPDVPNVLSRMRPHRPRADRAASPLPDRPPSPGPGTGGPRRPRRRLPPIRQGAAPRADARAPRPRARRRRGPARPRRRGAGDALDRGRAGPLAPRRRPRPTPARPAAPAPGRGAAAAHQVVGRSAVPAGYDPDGRRWRDRLRNRW